MGTRALREQLFASGVYPDVKHAQQIIELSAAPVASLFLLLTILPAAFPPSSGGVDLWLPQRAASWRQAFDECGDDRLIYLQLLPDGRSQINETPVRQAELQNLLTRIYETRNEEFLYFSGDARLSVAEVASVVGEAQGRLPRLRLIPITPE